MTMDTSEVAPSILAQTLPSAQPHTWAHGDMKSPENRRKGTVPLGGCSHLLSPNPESAEAQAAPRPAEQQDLHAACLWPALPQCSVLRAGGLRWHLSSLEVSWLPALPAP